MRFLELIPAPYRLLGLGLVAAALMGAVAAATWKVQDWRYTGQLAQQARAHSDILNQLAEASTAQQRLDQAKRLALEQRLQASDQTRYRELTDAQHTQARLRDRLATADLRLSVLLDTTGPAPSGAVPATPATGGVVHGATRARLDPAHAQRIIGITGDGDQGLIALAACQAYVKEATATK